MDYLDTNSYFRVASGSQSDYLSWSHTVSNYIADGINGKVQLYVGAELGINSLLRTITDQSPLAVYLKMFVNDIMLRLTNKKLFLASDAANNSEIKEDIFLKKELLNNRDISFSLDATYELVPPILTDIISELSILNFIDITPYFKQDDQTSSGINEKAKILNTIEIIILRYLVAGAKNKYVDKLENLLNTISTIKKNFKVLLIEYCALSIIASILKLQDNKPERLSYFKYSIERSVENIKTYIAVWCFEYYSIHSEYNSSLIYFGGEDLKNFILNIADARSTIMYTNIIEELNASGVTAFDTAGRVASVVVDLSNFIKNIYTDTEKLLM